MKIENIEKFTKCFETFVSENITPAQMIPVIKVDAEIKFADITPKFFRIMKQFAPFGPGNLSPLFLTKNVIDTGRTMPVGKNKEHLRIEMKDSDNKVLSGIAFSMAQHYKNIHNKKPFTVCYSLGENVFKGRINLQAVVKYIQF